MNMIFENKKFGKCELKDLTQKQFEEYSKLMLDYNKETLTVYRGQMLRTFAKLELLVEPDWKAEDVDNAHPGHVKFVADCIEKHLAEILNIDPLS